LKQKIFFFIVLVATSLFYLANDIAAYTPEQLTVNLGQPESPTTQDNFKLTFVALDKDPKSDITVGCYKKSPSDIDYVKFDTDKPLIPGGNTDSCVVDNTILSTSGSYLFKIIATTSTEVKESNIVTIDFTATLPPSSSVLGADTDDTHDGFRWWWLLFFIPVPFVLKKFTQKN